MLQKERDASIINIFSTVASYIDSLSAAFSFGLSYLWRKKIISLSGIKSGDMVLDICAGTGELTFLIEKKVRPHGSVIGVDFCEEMLGIARKR